MDEAMLALLQRMLASPVGIYPGTSGTDCKKEYIIDNPWDKEKT